MNTKMHQTIIPHPHPAAKTARQQRTPPAHPSKNASSQSAPQPTMSNNTTTARPPAGRRSGRPRGRPPNPDRSGKTYRKPMNRQTAAHRRRPAPPRFVEGVLEEPDQQVNAFLQPLRDKTRQMPARHRHNAPDGGHGRRCKGNSKGNSTSGWTDPDHVPQKVCWTSSWGSGGSI